MSEQQNAESPVVVKYAAFEVSPAVFDEMTRRFRMRGFHHVFDVNNNILMNYVALTRAAQTKAEEFLAAWVLENGHGGVAHRYMGVDEHGLIVTPETLNDDVLRFAREEDAKRFLNFVCRTLQDKPKTWKAVPHVWAT